MKAIISLVTFFILSYSAMANNYYCNSNQWWSQKYEKCFNKYGYCSQYDYTDHRTCNSSKDHLRCDWDKYSRTCYPEHNNSYCRHDEWYSKKYKRCFEKYGYCNQYNHTDHKTCNTGKDHLRCDWDSKRKICYSEDHY